MAGADDNRPRPRYHRGVDGQELTGELLNQIREGVDHLGSSLDNRINRLSERVDRLANSLGERLEGTDRRLDRVERSLLDLGKVMRKFARDQARYERFHHKRVG